MAYFNDLKLVMGKHIPGCRVHVKSSFPDTYSVEYIHGGRMYLRVNGGARHILERPAFFWHMPGNFYEYGPVDAGGWDHHYILLRGARGKRLVKEGFGSVSLAGFAFVARPGEVREIYFRLFEIMKDRTPALQAEGVILLERLLQIAAFSPGPDVEASGHSKKIRVLAERIRKAPLTGCDKALMAAELHVCVGYFLRLFRQHIHRSFHDYVLYCRMLKAAEWLEEPATQIKTAAYRVGYEDPAQFSKLFKKQIGLSPRQYREAILRG